MEREDNGKAGSCGMDERSSGGGIGEWESKKVKDRTLWTTDIARSADFYKQVISM
jgi:hypothetical protein